MTPESYCRDLEAYLCRKNDGHLIRITGPAFERVIRWAEEGIPFKVACAGVDRYFERYYRKGPRRRPVRIEFCEADVLDAFDDWRRAIGVAQDQGDAVRPKATLAAHIERAVARLTTLRASSQLSRAIDGTLERVARELDHMLTTAKGARGAARDSVLSELARLDGELVEAAMSAIDAAVRAEALANAKEQLTPFRERMTSDAYARACSAAVEQHVRDHFGLPTIAFG